MPVTGRERCRQTLLVIRGPGLEGPKANLGASEVWLLQKPDQQSYAAAATAENQDQERKVPSIWRDQGACGCPRLEDLMLYCDPGTLPALAVTQAQRLSS